MRISLLFILIASAIGPGRLDEDGQAMRDGAAVDHGDTSRILLPIGRIALVQEKEPEPDQRLIEQARSRVKGTNTMVLPLYAVKRNSGVRLENGGESLSWDDSVRIQIGTLGWTSASTLRMDPQNDVALLNVGPLLVQIGTIALEKGEYVKWHQRTMKKGVRKLVP